MKKIIIFLICIIMFCENSIGSCAAEDTIIANQSLPQKHLEENKNIQEELPEEGLSEEELFVEGTTEEQPEEIISEGEDIDEKTIEENIENIGETEQFLGEAISKDSNMGGENFFDESEEVASFFGGVQSDENTSEDPQYGRENGYTDEMFYGISSFDVNENEYIHNDRFADCLIENVIDVSKYQGDINWIKVKQAGIDYAIIRAGYRGYGEKGTLNTDSYFVKNIEQALAAGVQVGVYFFSQAISQEEAKAEAEYVLEQIKNYTISLPVVIDFEYASSNEGLVGRLYNANLSKDEATKICRKFCELVEGNGYTAMVYANKDMLENGLNASEIAKDYKVWLANYATSTSYEGGYQFWQYTQNGTIDGIFGAVDKNFWYKETESVYNGVDYSSVYNFKFYIEKYPDLKKAFGNNQKAAISHFVNYGMNEGRYGNSEFNVYTYRNRYADLRTTYRKNWKSYYMHYVKYGQKEGRDGSGSSELIKPVTKYNGIDYSAVYDYTYYLKHNAEINERFDGDDVGALEYFVNYGMRACHQANEAFNPMTYRNRYADLRKLYGDNWVRYYSHYMNYGKKEGRDGSGTVPYVSLVTSYKGIDYSEVYDYTYYTEKYPDIKKAYGNNENAVIAHFVNYGMSEGRQGKESFNVKTYRNKYADLRKIYGKNWKSYYTHYMNYGKKEGRNGSGTSSLINPMTVYNGVDYSLVYDFNYYITKYSDIEKLYGDDDMAALKHFANYGMSEGRQGKSDFNVYVYKSNNQDLINVYGNNFKSYYMHYINYGHDEGRQATDVGRIVSCKIADVTSDIVTVQVKIQLYEAIEKYENYYIIGVDSYNGNVVKAVLESRDGSDATEIVNITVTNREAKALLQGKIALGVKNSKDKMIISSPAVYISNPEALANNNAAIFQGTSKKGLQGITYASYDGGSDIVDARNANTKHTLLNLDLAKVVSATPKSGYIAYTYKDNTYYFSELTDLKTNIQSLNSGYQQYLYGNTGTTKVAVSLCLLLGYNSDTSYLIDPAARTPGRSYYMLNVREEKARETFEALFFYLGETFGQENCYVSNWVLGNEINSSKAWNYSGSLDFDTYMECYATAFRLLYTGVKSTKTGNTVSISLDNGWTAAPDTYSGKTTLDTFAKKIHEQNPNIEWSIAYHPYSYPLTRVDFWNDYSNTADSLSTKYISMRNINVLTNYAATLENTYGLPVGSIRVLLTEQGYSYSGGDKNQALAIARGYYIAEFNNRIDAFIIRAVVDDSDEAQGKLYFGLMNRLHEKRIAFYVYEHMDSDIDKLKNISPVGYVSEENYDKFNKAKEIVCNTNWSSIVPGFNKTKLANIR